MKLTDMEVKYINKVSTSYPIPSHRIRYHPSCTTLFYSILFYFILSNNIHLVSSRLIPLHSITFHPISSHLSHSILSRPDAIQFLSLHLVPPILLILSRPIQSYSIPFHRMPSLSISPIPSLLILSQHISSYRILSLPYPFHPIPLILYHIIPTHPIPLILFNPIPFHSTLSYSILFLSSHYIPSHPIPSHPP